MKRRANEHSCAIYKLPIELLTAIFALSLLSSRNRDGNYHSSLRLLRLMSFYWSRAFDDTHRLWTIVDSRGGLQAMVMASGKSSGLPLDMILCEI